jgi:hypothetical protein
MNKTIALAAFLVVFIITPAIAEKKAKKDSVSFDPIAYSCASFLKMIGSSAKSGEEEAGVAVMWGYGFLSGLEYAKSMEKPSALDDKTLAALVIDYASVCKQNPKISFFEATTKLAGASEKPAPPNEPDDQTPAAPDRNIPDMI